MDNEKNIYYLNEDEINNLSYTLYEKLGIVFHEDEIIPPNDNPVKKSDDISQVSIMHSKQMNNLFSDFSKIE